MTPAKRVNTLVTSKFPEINLKKFLTNLTLNCIKHFPEINFGTCQNFHTCAKFPTAAILFIDICLFPFLELFF